mgnify:CR=1 FL=1
MIKNRRVGTLTAGISMIVFGGLFLLRLVIPAITIHLIASLWPIVLIFLGTEILIAYVCNKEGQMKYDAGSVIIIIVLGIFSISMAAAQMVIENVIHFL